MPTAGGPNTLGESNLVFAYDTGDVSNSYRGQPTTNLEASNIDTTFESNIDGDTAGFNNQLGSGNYLGVSSTMGYKSSKSLRINRGTGGTGRVYKTYSVSTGQYSSVSCWVYSTTAGPFLALEYFGGDYSWGVGYTNNTHTGTGWEFLYVRTTGPATSNTTAYYFLYPSIQNQDIYLDNIQTELKQYPTTFVNGTRSATQGLLPLVGNSTIDLSNVSFDSSAKMIFDGTDDYINSSVTLGTEITLEILIQSSNYSGNRIPISINGDAYSSGPNLYFTNNIIAWNTGNGDANPFANSYYPNSNYHHIVVTNVFGGTAILYIDGIQIGTATSLNTTTTGANKLIIGNYHDGGYAISANIPITKLYNRALTAQEVKQNYQQYKTRFNLS